MSVNILTQKELKNFVSFNSLTGGFTRLICPTKLTQIGKIIVTKPRKGYLHITINKTLYPAHRLAWLYVYGEWPNIIDHINHDRTDNRIVNLRSVSSFENSKNKSMASRNKTGITGVHWDKERGKWHAQIHIKYHSKSLGRYADKFEAICARLSANNKYGFHENHGV